MKKARLKLATCGLTLLAASQTFATDYPHNAAEVKQQNPGAPDGEYMIDPDGPGGNPPFSVYCYNMAEIPKEYLSLARVGEGTNFAMYKAGGGRSGTDIYTHFYKIRLNLPSLAVDTRDLTFSVSRGVVGGTMTNFFYAAAGDCVAPYSKLGRANVDLRDTPLRIDPSVQFSVGPITQSYLGAGSATFSADRKVVDLTGGGYCGDYEPVNPPGLVLSFDPSLVEPAIAPTIDATGQPQSQTPPLGGTATFAVTAIGTLPITYQWRFNGANILGATNASYTVSPAGLANLGGYDVAVANSAGTNMSSVASLALLDLKMLAAVYLSATNGSRYRIDAATELAPTNWITVTNVTITTQPYIYVDYASPTNTYKFYRAVPQ